MRDIVLPLFWDSSSEGDVRIAAFNTFMSTINCDSPWPTDDLETIANSVHSEKNSQVQSAVYTHLKELANTSDPSLKCRYEQIAHEFEIIHIDGALCWHCCQTTSGCGCCRRDEHARELSTL